MAVTLTRSEQETIIRWDAEDKRVLIYTADPAVKRSLARKGYVLEDVGTHGWRCVADPGVITIRRAVRAPVKLTEAERKVRSDRMRSLHERRKAANV